MQENRKNNFLISIIMNCHNGEKHLYESLNSIINQSYKNWELIFWDNMSSDSSPNIVKNINDNRIKYFSSNKFEKLYKARNLALEKCTGDFICFLDTDDFWSKKFLQKCLDQIIKCNCNIVYSKYFIKNEIKNKIYLNEKKELPSGIITKSLFKKYLIGINAIFLKREVFEKQKFNSEYQIIGDFDFFMRLSFKNEFYAIQEPLLTYRHHNANFTNKNMNLYVREYNNWIKNNEKEIQNNYYLLLLKYNGLKLKFKLIILKLKELIL
tara:strand:- start:456 stop:1256 length:801 start_codon:yes stop_codon:yes gene_type:complete